MYAPPHSPPPAPPSLTVPTVQKWQVLIADDSPLNRKLLCRRVEAALPSARLILAETGEQALELLLGGKHTPRHLSRLPKRPHLPNMAGTHIDVALLDENFALADRLKGSDVSRRVREAERRRQGEAAGPRVQPGEQAGQPGEARRCRPALAPMVMIGCTGDAGLGDHSNRALDSGQVCRALHPPPLSRIWHKFHPCHTRY